MHLREYGFPRKKEDTSTGMELKKKSFKWKKTNFVTDLPKHNPIVRYLVAKSRNPSLTDSNEFYMHTVVLYHGNNYKYLNQTHLEFHDDYKQQLSLFNLKM